MPGKVMKIGTFSDWIGLFKEWRAEIGVNNDDIKNFGFETLYGAIETEEISFGYYKGRPKWENLRQIPTQNMRDALLNLIVYQGDTEFASVEQQRYLFETAPTDWDRDGKFQLQMLKYSAFAPLGRSMSYMLKEEAFHMGTGNTGLARIAEAGVVPGWLMQKYLNKWISSAYDLFGTDNSSSAHWAYVWGLKGRYDELKNTTDPQLDDLNDYNRQLYRDECAQLVRRISIAQKPGNEELYCPDIKFNRMIGRWKGQYFHPKTGQMMEEKEYKQMFDTWMPTPADKKLLMDIVRSERKWITSRAGAKDPLLTIGEVRKNALNASVQ